MTYGNSHPALFGGTLRSRLARASAAVALVGVIGASFVGCDDDTTEPKTGGVKVQISGEDAAVDGFPFPQTGEVAFADGWSLHFDHVLVAIDHVTLSSDPDLAPSDQSKTGPVVAKLDGPWIVDLSKPGTETGAGGEGKAILVGRIADQNAAGGAAFDGTQRYAFGFEMVAASASATRLNFADDAEANTIADEMIAKGWNIAYVGTATFAGGASCTTSDAAYDATKIPTTVPFTFGFATPTRFSNCQNQNNEGTPFDGEEYQRGVAIPTNTDAVAQMTLHLEHAWFTDVVHDSALRFDDFAAQLVGSPAGTRLTLDDLVGVDPTAVTDGAGAALPWRNCDGTALPSGAQMRLETGSVPVDPAGAPSSALRDLKDFVGYVQSTQGHLNGGEGLCFVDRQYPSPP